MSHTTTLRSVQIKDIQALRAAVAELKASGVNCDLVENEVPSMYYANQHGKCAYVLRMNDANYGGRRYDVGFDLQPDGTYATVFDDFGNALRGQIGAACPMPNTAEGKAQHAIGKFLQGYAKHAAMNAALAQGYMVESCTVDANNNVQLTLTM